MSISSVEPPFLFEVYVQPGAKTTEVAGYHGKHLKIRLKADPVDNQANQELIAFLAKRLDISKKEIAIVRGKASRIKTGSINGGQEAVERLYRDFGYSLIP